MRSRRPFAARKRTREGLRGRVASPNELGYVLAAGYLDRHRPAARVGLRDRPRETLALLLQQRQGLGLERRRRHRLGLGRRAARPEGLDARRVRLGQRLTASARWRGSLRTHRFEDLLKAHTARLDALKACKAEIVKAPTPKAMTETPLEGDAMMILKAKMMAGK